MPETTIFATSVAGLIDFTLLPETLLTVGQMLSEGYTQRQIAASMGRPESWVSGRVQELKAWIVEQALERADELVDGVRARLAEARKT